jgi:GNAT superfamily N-acetyltransferase
MAGWRTATPNPGSMCRCGTSGPGRRISGKCSPWRPGSWPREPLREGYVEAFGVDPRLRRRGVGTALQQHAARQCRIAGCYQLRSRSPVTSTENYALKIAAGYVLHPSHENDSYYFLLRL